MDRLAADLERARRLTILALFVMVILFILFEALRGEHFWNKVKGEGNLWNYGSSLVYFMVGEMAIVNAVLVGYHERITEERGRSWRVLIWAAVGAAFVFFACDEMLTIHEKLGLAIESSMPWVSHVYPGRADNLITAGYGLGAVLFTIFLLRSLQIDSKTRGYFFAGMLMTIGAAALDVIPRELYVNYLPFRETEELLEVFAGFSFTASFISFGAFTLAGILRAADERLSEAITESGVIESGPRA